MKAVAVVAHLDDCVIFAYGFIHHYAKYTIESVLYSLDEFPLHRNVVAGFHQQHHTNKYTISERVRKLL
jgi:hypothetical protein